MQVPTVSTPPVITPQLTTYPQKIFKWAVIISLLITVAASVLYSFLQPVIPLFYTLAQPDQQLVAKIWIFLFPIFAWLVTLLHFFLLKTMKNLEGSIERIFSWTTVGVIGVTCLLFIRLVLAVT